MVLPYVTHADNAYSNPVHARHLNETPGQTHLNPAENVIRLQIWHPYHILYGMKMTLHIDEALLARVIASTGARSKTQAVDLALREMDRKATLLKLSSTGLGLAADQLKETLDPAYDLEAARQAELPAHYGHKPRSR
jgi:Arc/MetJ family transcription regulator